MRLIRVLSVDAKLLELARKELKLWDLFPKIKPKSTPNTFSREEFEDESIVTKFFAQLGYLLLTIIGYFILIFLPPRVNTEKHRKGYVPGDRSELQFVHHGQASAPAERQLADRVADGGTGDRSDGGRQDGARNQQCA